MSQKHLCLRALNIDPQELARFVIGPIFHHFDLPFNRNLGLYDGGKPTAVKTLSSQVFPPNLVAKRTNLAQRDFNPSVLARLRDFVG